MVRDYSGLVWPAGHMSSALNRADSGELDEEVSALYRKLFDQAQRQIEPLELPVPFAQSCRSELRFQFLTAQCEQLPLSIVTVTRNDNHVEQMQERTQAFIDCIYYLADKHQTPVELIIVEWNPPADKPRLNKAFNFPDKHSYVSCAIFTVKHELHAKYQHSDNLPLYQMIGKNVGIRRAQGRFILATNIDVLLSEKLFLSITSPSLEPGRIYRSNRWDIDRTILNAQTPEEQLSICPDKVLQINYASGPANSTENESSPPDHRISWFPDLHTWACGDFQLMHRQDWAKVGGYSELDAYSYHLDSLFALTCYHAGIDEYRFDNTCPHYHIDHTLGVQVNASEYTINENKTIKHLSLGDLLNIHLLMRREGDYVLFNHDDWGLANAPIARVCATTADWQAETGAPKALPTQNGSGSCISLTDLHIDFQDVSKRWVEQAVSASVKYLMHAHPDAAYYLWGTGQRAAAFGELLKEQGIAITGYIGNVKNGDPVKQNLVTAPETFFKASHSTTAPPLILITSMYADEIIQTLAKADKAEGKDYIVLY